MSTESGSVGLVKRDDVAYLELQAPPHNILTCRLMGQMSAALDEIAKDETLKAVALTAQGKAFSAGADVGEHAPERAAELMAAFGGLFRRLAGLELPVVMAVDGAALGGGFELVMMADVLLASDRATFGQPEIRLGFFAPVAVVRLPALVGPTRATEIVCSGRTYTAEEMQRYGLVARIVPSSELGAALESTLGDLRRASPLIMRMNVRMLKRLGGRPFAETLQTAEAAFVGELMATEDVREGISSFFEKRRPQWKNR
jgi:cyclohexa-1,5-dienecarbonyl-CoA hydratase